MGKVVAAHSEHINAPVEDVLAVLRNIADQHEWWPGQYRSDVLTLDARGRVTSARIGNDVKIAKDDFTVRYTHDMGDRGYRWALERPSLIQRAQVGSWSLAPLPDGTCDTTLAIEIMTPLPLPRFVLSRAVGDSVRGAVKGLKRRCESAH